MSIIKKLSTILATIILLAGLIVTPSVSAQNSQITSAPNIVETAISNGSFSTLVAAVKAADLAQTLSGTGPFTVLAPTNEAFAKIPADILAKLLLPENKDVLTKILTYHVVSGSVDSTTIKTLDAAKTLEGTFFGITTVNDTIVLNTDTNVVIPDIKTSNGIIHAIDSVLIPEEVYQSGFIPREFHNTYYVDDYSEYYVDEHHSQPEHYYYSYNYDGDYVDDNYSDKYYEDYHTNNFGKYYYQY
jgi:uncharacterized surface protein with fasciclin (FAS1) repeats